MEHLAREGRSLAETPTYSVASVVTVLVFVCFLVERSIYRFGKWLKKTRRKALFASLEKIKEELMLLGLISLLLSQCARWISEICVNSSLFSSKFYICSEEDYGINKKVLLDHNSSTNKTHHGLLPHRCGQGREPFVSYEGLEQLLRFLFVLGITHVLYSGVAIGLAMSKIYSWRKWESQAILMAEADVLAKKTKVMMRQSTFVFHHASHPWSKNRVLIWMLCFLRQFRGSIQKSDYLALRHGFITKHKLPLTYNFHMYMVRSMEDEFQGIVGISWPLWVYAILCICINIHGLNLYFWLSFIPAILVMLVGTKLEQVVSKLALEVKEQTGTPAGAQVKPRDDLFWFGKPVILLRLIQFIIFQNAFEMATFIWFLWGIKERSCFMKNHVMISIRLVSGVLVQFWCSYGTVPLNVIVTQMGSRCKKAVIAESVRESLHSWCKRVKERSKHTARSVCSLDTATIDERDEITVGTLSRSSSMTSLNQITITSTEQADSIFGDRTTAMATMTDREELTSRVEEYLSDTLNIDALQPLNDDEIEEEEEEDNNGDGREVDDAGETLLDLFRRT
ncbi:PREDICTED: MLO-like protein 4 [Tarenaya hassleriana]|uniref:MLO-like protein 4 n=1 Tax=Tarenaya hassleriana TaxID=28532 RepID=UPI00053C285E|nr:PREDICTED: MLO-like protein 4 [Tarenaya hassleriana]